MARGAVVVILSDGWERGDPTLVGQEMERLARLAHRIVWVNPRVGATAFSVRAGGMVAALPVLRRARQRPQLRGARRGRRGDRGAVVGRRGRTAPPPAAADELAGETETLGQRHAGAGQLGRDAERLRAEQGQRHARLGDRAKATPMSDARPRSASTRAASDPPCRRTRRAGRSRRSATSKSTMRSPPIRSGSGWQPARTPITRRVSSG